MRARPTSSPCSPSTGPAGRCSASASRRHSTRRVGRPWPWRGSTGSSRPGARPTSARGSSTPSPRSRTSPTRASGPAGCRAGSCSSATSSKAAGSRHWANSNGRPTSSSRSRPSPTIRPTPACNGSPTRPRPSRPAPLASRASASSTTPNPAASGSPCNGRVRDGAALGEPIDVYVPPGESRVVRVPRPKGTATARAIVLKGDSARVRQHPVCPRRAEARGDRPLHRRRSRRRPEWPAFYLMRVFVDTPRRTVKVVPRPPTAAVSLDPEHPTPLVILAAETSPENARRLRANAQAGGTVLYVATRPAGRDPRDPAGRPASSHRGGVFPARRPASARSPSITRCSPRSPARSTATSPRSISGSIARSGRARRRVLARFENGDPAVIEKPTGKGSLVVMASGWNPADSQLARSSKFVPLMMAMLDRHDPRPFDAEEHTVGDRSRSRRRGTDPKGWSCASRRARPSRWRRGRRISNRRTSRASTRSTAADGPRSFVVNLDPAESKTSALNVETLEQFGCRLANPVAEAGRPGAAPAVAERRAGRSPEALAVADPGGHRHPDRRNRPGGADQADPPGRRPSGGPVVMSGRLRQALEQVARRFRSVRLWGGLAACWLVLALPAGAIAALGPLPGMADVPAAWVPALLALLAAMLGMGLRTGRHPHGPRSPVGRPCGSSRGTPSSAPSCSPPSTRSRPLPAAGSASSRRPSSARPSNTAAPTTGMRPSPPGCSASRSWPTPPASHASWSCVIGTLALPVALLGLRRPARELAGRCVRGPGRARRRRDRARQPAPGRRPLQPRRAGRRQPRDRRRRPGPAPPPDDPQPRGPDLRRPRRVGPVRPRLPRRVRRPEHRRPTASASSSIPSSGGPTPTSSSPLHRRSAQGRRGHPPRHGRRGDRADPDLPAQQGRRLRRAGRQGGAVDRR